MTVIRNIVVAFSMYSQIPMPVFEWKDDDMKYAISFLPLVGLVIGIAEFLCLKLLGLVNLSAASLVIVASLLWMAIPVIVTGGFHLDGFMDVMDAVKSFKSKEEKLAILKDPHIGAFSVISLVLYGITYFALTISVLEMSGLTDSFVMTKDKGYELLIINTNNRGILICCLGFYIVRCFCSITSIVLPHAKKSGMLHNETSKTGKTAIVIIIFELIIGIIASFLVDINLTAAMITALVIYTYFYNRKCQKAFGGVSGDTAGYYVVVGEFLVMLVTFTLLL